MAEGGCSAGQSLSQDTMPRRSNQDRTARAEGRAESARRSRVCRRGHYVSADRRRACSACHRINQRKYAAARRRQKMAERRKRIAARHRPKRVERIWAAGHFEGEGTFTIVRIGNRGYTRPAVVLSSTDKSMVDVFHENWPGNTHAHWPSNPNARKQFTWMLQSLDRIEGFILDIRPYIKSERVRAKAALLLEDIRARASGYRSPQALAKRKQRHLKMRALNRRGV